MKLEKVKFSDLLKETPKEERREPEKRENEKKEYAESDYWIKPLDSNDINFVAVKDPCEPCKPCSGNGPCKGSDPCPCSGPCDPCHD